MKNLKEKLEQLLKESEAKKYKIYGGKEKSIYINNEKKVLDENEKKITNGQTFAFVDENGEIFEPVYSNMVNSFDNHWFGLADFAGMDRLEFFKSIKNFSKNNYFDDFEATAKKAIEIGEDFFIATLIDAKKSLIEEAINLLEK